jgi:putative phosphoribosyl transferase
METEIQVGDAVLEGDLTIPEDPHGVVLFAHGSGSSRHSPRNKQVAEALQHAGLGTLLFDLLTTDEDEVDRVTGELRFNISLLAERLAGATGWLLEDPSVEGLSLGYFGASTGAAAALIAAASRPDDVAAVVSRGGRPDLAPDAFESVRAPTLLIVGGRDTTVIEMNRSAMEQLQCETQLEIVEGASHLFEEPGALEQVSSLAADWFSNHFNGATDQPQVSNQE